MEMIPYKYLAFGDSPDRGYWDMKMLDDFFQDELFTTEPGEGSVVVIPGPYQGPYIKEINEALAKFTWVLLLITSDEENKFPIEEIKHPNIKIYLHYPRRNRHEQYGKIPSGYIPTTRENLKFVEKDLDYFFSGQVTHWRRRLLVQAMRKLPDTFKKVVQGTAGFAQGLAHDQYIGYMNRAKVVPAPSGAVTADSFRVFEALEAGAIPIADNICAGGPANDPDFWQYIFGDVPFPTTNDFSDLQGKLEHCLSSYPVINNRAQAWWIKYKRDLKWQFIHDVEEMTGRTYRHDITVVIPTSPIKSHPETTILDETISTIRTHLPKAEILITFDGVRKQQEDRRQVYEEFIRRALFKCNTEWNAVPIIFDNHHHQSGMALSMMHEVKTPTVLYVEQDTPLAPDLPIDFKKCVEDIKRGDVNVIRFHHESLILAEHKHMMLGEPANGLYRTVQWSNRPHLANTEFYKRILAENFNVHSNCFLEDKLHGVVHEDYIHNGEAGWNRWRVAIYYPEDGMTKRSYHTDGRAGEQKFEAEQIF